MAVKQPNAVVSNPAIRHFLYWFSDTCKHFSIFYYQRTRFFTKFRVFWWMEFLLSKIIRFPTYLKKNRNFLILFKNWQFFLIFEKCRYRLKVYKSVIKFNYKWKNLNVLKNFSSIIFSLSYVPGVNKGAFIDNKSLGTCRFVNPRLTENREAQIVFNFLYLAFHFL